MRRKASVCSALRLFSNPQLSFFIMKKTIIVLSSLLLASTIGTALYLQLNASNTATTCDFIQTPDLIFENTPAPTPVFVNQTTKAAFNPHFKDAKPLPKFFEQSIHWLVQAQQTNGGWGAGLSSRQDLLNPHEVKTDPATSAFVGMALIRMGNTLQQGAQKENLEKVFDYLLLAVDNTPENSTNVSAETGTQIQAKLGQNIDVALTSQFFSRMLPLTENKPDLQKKAKKALEKCVKIIENAQQSNGSWNNSGWAPVLNSAMAGNALELAQENGIQVDTAKLAASQQYQRDNLSSEGAVKTESAAGVALYQLSSSQRTNAKLRSQAYDILYKDAPADAEKAPASSADIKKELRKNGVSEKDAKAMSEAVVTYNNVSKQIYNDDVLSGFGNNGGEEFLSYMMTSESFVKANDDQWDTWHKKMAALFEKIQNQDGSWNGHHCITSPVFCTAAVIMTLTADRDGFLTDLKKRK
jgi:hypothetical protein